MGNLRTSGESRLNYVLDQKNINFILPNNDYHVKLGRIYVLQYINIQIKLATSY